MSGDWNLLTYPFDDLRGGYNAYERRMVARLADKNDPSRPDFSSASTVAAFFFYASIPNVAQIRDIIRFVKQFIEFFKIQLDDYKALPVAKDLKVSYGLSSQLTAEFDTLSKFLAANNRVPDQFNVSWGLSVAGSKVQNTNLPLPAPPGFLVEISTVREGLKLFYERPAPDSPSVTGNNDAKTTLKEYGQVQDPQGNALTLFGGEQAIKFDKDLQYNANVDSNGNLRKGGNRVYAIKTQADKYPIDLSLLKQGDRYIYQRTFFVNTSEVTPNQLFTLGNRFDITIDTEDLPFDADFKIESGLAALGGSGDGKVSATITKQPGTYYVRVTPVSDQVTRNEEFKYVLDKTDFGTPGVPVQVRMPNNDKGNPLIFGTDIGQKSEPTTVTVPSNDTVKFIDGLTVALAVAFLSRSELPPILTQLESLGGPFTATQVNDFFLGESDTVPSSTAGLETRLEGVSSILKRMYRDLEGEHNKKKLDPRGFRRKLLNTCRKFANELYQDMGPSPALEKQIADSTTNLRTWKWTESQNPEFRENSYMFPELTILESLESTEVENGLAANPWSVGAAEEVVERNFYFNNNIGTRTPGFLQTKRTFVHEVFKAEMTQKEINEVLAVKPHLEDFVLQYREVTDAATNKVVYRFPQVFLNSFNDFSFVLGSADSSPVLYGNQENLIRGEPSGKVLFCRNVIDATVYEEARTILQIATAVNKRATKDGEWVAGRLFSSLPELSQFFEMINGWVKSIKAGSKSSTDGIIAYIEFLQARVTELQNLVNRINSLLQVVVRFKFVSASILPVIANGTEGIISALVNSTNKPQDGAAAYSAGLVMLAGGAPSFIVDLFSEN
jgi:hypothetical protein